jgi:septal ring-binding cell division protein DamX
VAILVFAAVLMWQDDIRQLFNKPAATSIASVTEDGPQPLQSREAAGETAAEKTIQLGITEPAQQAASDSEVESTQAETVTSMPSSAMETAPATGPDEVKTASTLVVSAIEPDPVPASDRQQTLTLKGKGFDATTRITVEWANQRKTLLQNRLHLVDENRLDFDVTVGTKPDTWVVIVRNPQTGARATTQFVVKPVATKTVTPAADHPDSLEDLAWLKRQPANHFTLQLLASPQITSLREFVKQHDLAGKAVMFETRTRDGKPWYALAYGSYPSHQAAEQASLTLPAGIKPWIRRFASVQEGLARSSVAIPSAASVPQGNNLQEHAAWLWAQDPSHYTLQLLAGRNEQAVQQFIARHRLAGQAVFYQTTREDKPWFVVVMGSFADRARALSARDKLSADLRQQSPWPRAFSEIHADLSRH